MSLTKIDAKEKVSKSFKMRGNTAVEIAASVKPSEGSSVAFRWNLVVNFADCTPQAIMLYAARHLLVVAQGKFRKAYNAEGADREMVAKSSDWDIFFVKKYSEQERQGATPMQRAVAAASKMSEAEKAELIAALSK